MSAALLVFLGGGLGSLCRFGISKIVASGVFPFSTLVANILSCLILGLFIGAGDKLVSSSRQSLFLMTGFCGGFSTFSAFSADLLRVYQNGHEIMAVIYLMGSILSGLGFLLLGMFLAKWILF